MFDGSRLLLVRLPAGYGFVKGPLLLNETLEQAAVREVREEAALIVQPIRYIGKVDRPSREDGGEPVRKHIELFTMQILGEANNQPEKRTEWVPYDHAIANMWHPEEAEFLRVHRSEFITT